MILKLYQKIYFAIKKKEIDLDGFYEGKINFMTTYTFLDGTNEYDYAEKVPLLDRQDFIQSK